METEPDWDREAALHSQITTMRQALEIIALRDCDEPDTVATEVLTELGFWKKV